MDPPPHYASTYGALHFSNFSVKRAEIPDVKLSQETVNNATILIDEKWPEYIFENELNAKEKWENYQRMKEMEMEANRQAEEEEKERKRIENEKKLAEEERLRAEAEAEELKRAERVKREAEAEAMIKAREEAAALNKQKAKDDQEKAERREAVAEICSVTGLSEPEAETLLDKHGNSRDSIRIFFDDSISTNTDTQPVTSSYTSLLSSSVSAARTTVSNKLPGVMSTVGNNISAAKESVSTNLPVAISAVSNNVNAAKSTVSAAIHANMSNMSAADRAREVANLERIERIRQEDRLLAARMSNLTNPTPLDHDIHDKDRSIQDLINDYSTDDTFSQPAGQPIAALATPLRPFSAANPLITTDPFSSSPSPRTPVVIPSATNSQPSGMPPPVYPQPPAYGAVTGSDFPSEHSDKVEQLMALTHASESQCQLLLMCENFDLDRACDSFFSGDFRNSM